LIAFPTFQLLILYHRYYQHGGRTNSRVRNDINNTYEMWKQIFQKYDSFVHVSV